jgi:hypothetical protein
MDRPANYANKGDDKDEALMTNDEGITKFKTPVELLKSTSSFVILVSSFLRAVSKTGKLPGHSSTSSGGGVAAFKSLSFSSS